MKLRFIEEFLKDRSITYAAIRAGYSEKTAYSSGHRLLKDPEVRAAIDKAMIEASERNGVTVDRILAELMTVGFADIGDVMDFSENQVKIKPANQISENARRTISSIKVRRRMDGDERVEIIEFKLWDKMAALEKLGKYRGMFVDRQEISGPNGGPVEMLLTETIIDANDPKNDPPAPGAT